MDERLNQTPLQVKLLQKMLRENECRISHMAKNNTAIVVVHLEDEQYLSYEVKRRGSASLVTVFPESYSSFQAFNQMLPIAQYQTFSYLYDFSKSDRLLTREDMIHFSTDQLSSLCDIAIEELLRRIYVRDFINEKIEHSKKLFAEAYRESVYRFEEIIAEAIRSIDEEEPDLSWNSYDSE